MIEGKQFLSSYRHLNGKHREWTERIFTESVLHFANPATFNDPFDCKVHFQPTKSINDIKWKLVDLIKKRMPELNRKERRRKAAADIRAIRPNKFLSDLRANLQIDVDKIGILSLSATDRNILLWSHYAAGHTGLCLKFTASNDFFGSALPVTYAHSYPKVNIQDPPDKLVDAFLLTKAEAWRYEEEWRIIDHDGGSGTKLFPAELLVGVVLGALMPPEDKLTVAE